MFLDHRVSNSHPAGVICNKREDRQRDRPACRTTRNKIADGDINYSDVFCGNPNTKLARIIIGTLADATTMSMGAAPYTPTGSGSPTAGRSKCFYWKP